MKQSTQLLCLVFALIVPINSLSMQQNLLSFIPSGYNQKAMIIATLSVLVVSICAYFYCAHRMNAYEPIDDFDTSSNEEEVINPTTITPPTNLHSFFLQQAGNITGIRIPLTICSNTDYQASSPQTQLILVLGDIVKQKVQAIVNASNTALWLGRGVSEDINIAASTASEWRDFLSFPNHNPTPLQQELEKFDVIRKTVLEGEVRCETGNAVITSSCNLKTWGIQYIIHAVGPIIEEKTSPTIKDEQQLASAYKNSLQLTEDNKIKTIAFPPISTGIFGYPVEDAAQVAIKAVCEYAIQHPGVFEQIVLVSNKEEVFNAYKSVAESHLKNVKSLNN